MAHFISEKALDRYVWGTGEQTDVRASYSETNGRFRLREMHIYGRVLCIARYNVESGKPRDVFF